MKTREELQQENEALKFKIKQLEELNHWYIEQLKLRSKEKFAKSSEKAGETVRKLRNEKKVHKYFV